MASDEACSDDNSDTTGETDGDYGRWDVVWKRNWISFKFIMGTHGSFQWRIVDKESTIPPTSAQARVKLCSLLDKLRPAWLRTALAAGVLPKLGINIQSLIWSQIGLGSNL